MSADRTMELASRSHAAQRWTLSIALILTGSMLSAAGCERDDPPVKPTPTTASPTTVPPTTTATPAHGGPPAGWEEKYSAGELKAYKEALSRWQRFRQRLVRLEREGKHTAEAQRVFEEYRVSPQAGAHALRAVEKNGYRFEEPYEPLWSMAGPVQLSADGKADGAVVVIRQCTDYSAMRVTKDGQDVSAEVRPKHVVTTLLIKMTNLGGKWKYVDSTLRDKKSCAG